MNLVAFLGSPREKGNTDILLEKAINVAKEKNISVKKVVLNGLNIKPCQECNGCRKTGACVILDDMAFIYDWIDEADIILVASPIFFGNLSAQTKIMIDRMQCRWVGKYLLKQRPVTAGKVGGFICCGALKSEMYFSCASTVIDIFFKVLDIKYKERYFLPGVDKKGDVLKKAGVQDAISEMMERLAA